MAVHIVKSRTSGKKFARRARAKGYNAHVYKIKGRRHARVSVTRR